mgnify:CR=1 FL=1
MHGRHFQSEDPYGDSTFHATIQLDIPCDGAELDALTALLESEVVGDAIGAFATMATDIKK